MNKNDFEYIFEKNEDDSFVRLIIPAKEPYDIPKYEEELNLINKLPQDYTLEEVVRMKKYAEKLEKKDSERDS